MNDLEQILEGLVRQTADGKLQWRSTVIDDEFVTAVDTIGIAVRELGRNSFGLPTLRRQLEIHDEKGATVAVMEVSPDSQQGSDHQCATADQASRLNTLYELARRSALDPDAILAKLVNLLSE